MPDDKPQFTITGSALQATLFAALRVIGVLFAGGTAILGFVGKRDLTGLINYIQSSDFTPVAAAIAAVITFAYGLYKTHFNRNALIATKTSPRTIVPDDVLTVKSPGPGGGGAMLAIPVLFLLVAMPGLSGCQTTTADSVRLNTNKAFYTAQIALKSSQQTVLVVCSSPARPAAACNKGIDLLRTAAKAEAAGFTAQQAGNSADLQSVLITLTALPSELAALGLLEAK